MQLTLSSRKLFCIILLYDSMFFSTVSDRVQFYRFKEDDSSEVNNKINKGSTILIAEIYSTIIL